MLHEECKLPFLLHRLTYENDGNLDSMEIAERFISWRAATRIPSLCKKSKISALEFCSPS